MPKLAKNLLALTFKYDCDRFLRFRLLSKGQREDIGLEDAKYKRPGIELVEDAGRRWEAEKFQDLVDSSPAGSVAYRLADDEDPAIGRRPFAKVVGVFDLLRADRPPLAVVEGEFSVPVDVVPGLREAYERFGLEAVNVRPDILWIRQGPTGAPLVGEPDPRPPLEIHIIDVKMAAEPSLRHFTEVTYYALSLAAALEEAGLAERYGVSAEGFIWPGSHDANAFRNKVREQIARGTSVPVEAALLETLQPVPYEVYQVHVRQFFEDRLLRVLGQAPLEAAWHVAPKCQTCEFLRFCHAQAEEADHLCRIPWLNRGQARLLESRGITTTRALAEAIEHSASPWVESISSSHQLRAEGPAILSRARALQTGQPEAVVGRRSALMPTWSNLNIYLTVHFDPGSGITFAMGAKRVYFPHGRNPGDRPEVTERWLPVDRVDGLNTDTERRRLTDFVALVTGWLEEVSRANQALPARERMSAHVFFWDHLEIRQLRRMIERHMGHEDVVGLIELLVRMFPPDRVLPDPDLFRSQPGTAVKEVVRHLVGLPLAHDYSLLDVANALHPDLDAEGNPYRYRLPYGFVTELSDQIPFERAYEIWRDQVMLTRVDPSGLRRKYDRQEILEGIERAVKVRLAALEAVVKKLRTHFGDRLTLKKSGFSAAPPVQTRIPELSRRLVAFERLDTICQDIKNRQDRALPVEEREARFVSIRGIEHASGGRFDALIARARASDPRLASRQLLAFTFAPTSRDARIRERDFLLALSNEDSALDLDVPWSIHLDLSFDEARARSSVVHARAPLRQLLQVELAGFDPTGDPPALVIAPDNVQLFQLAQSEGLLDLNRVMVLDPLYVDFRTGLVEPVLRAVGGTPPPQRRRRG